MFWVLAPFSLLAPWPGCLLGPGGAGPGAFYPLGGRLPGNVTEPIKKQTSLLALLVLPRETRPLCQFPSLHRQVRNGSLPQQSLSLNAQASAWLSAPHSMRRILRTSVPTTLHTALRLKLTLPPGGRVSALMLRGSRSSSRSRTGSMVMIV